MTAGSATVSGGGSAASTAKIVLLALAAGQFLMTLDSSVMNVSISYVAEDLGTTVTGIQSAITLYTLVMASFMIIGGKIGSIIGSRRAFRIGLVIYGAGSFTTAIAPNLGVLLFGWSFLEGIGAVLILPAIVSLVAANFPVERRAATFGLIAASGAMAVAAGPLIGGAVTTYASWRWVFAGEVVIVIAIMLVTGRFADVRAETHPPIDYVGAVLSAAALGMMVFGVLRTSEWGWVAPKPDAPELLGLSASAWLILGGLAALWCFVLWENRTIARGRDPLIHLGLFQNKQLVGGLTLFFFQYFLQSGIFFTIPLFLSVVLELSALDTGLRLVPLSVALLIFAVGIPKLFPSASPRTVVRAGLVAMVAGSVVMISGLEPGASAAIVAFPLFLIGAGIGALASQLGGVTVSAVSDEESAEVGGLQNTATNLGASFATALVGSVLIATLSASMITNIANNPDVPEEVKTQASVELEGGVQFISTSDLEELLAEANVPAATADAVVEANDDARYDALRAALLVVVIAGLVSLFFTGRIPTVQPGRDPAT